MAVWVSFFLGLVLGTCAGVFVTGMCHMAGDDWGAGW
jgi:hypothetical protein